MKELDNELTEYQPPAIVYEGKITTRAGSPLRPPAGGDSIDPSELFGKGN